VYGGDMGHLQNHTYFGGQMTPYFGGQMTPYFGRGVTFNLGTKMTCFGR